MKKLLALALATVMAALTLTGCAEKETTWTVTCPWAASGVAAMVSQKAAAMSTYYSDNTILVAEAIAGDTATMNSWIAATASDDPALIFGNEGMFSISPITNGDALNFTYDDVVFIENLYSAIFVLSADATMGIEGFDDLEAYMADGNSVTVACNGAVSPEAFLATALFGEMGYGDQMKVVAYTSAAEAAQAVSRGETDFAVSHQSQILETYNQGGVTMVCAFDEGPITSGPFEGLTGVGEEGYPYFRNRAFILAPAGADEDDIANLKALYNDILNDEEMATWMQDTMLIEVDQMTEADVEAHLANVSAIVNEYSHVLMG